MAVAFTRKSINEGRDLKDKALRHLSSENLDENFSFMLIIIFPLASVVARSKFLFGATASYKRNIF